MFIGKVWGFIQLQIKRILNFSQYEIWNFVRLLLNTKSTDKWNVMMMIQVLWVEMKYFIRKFQVYFCYLNNLTCIVFDVKKNKHKNSILISISLIIFTECPWKLTFRIWQQYEPKCWVDGSLGIAFLQCI